MSSKIYYKDIKESLANNDVKSDFEVVVFDGNCFDAAKKYKDESVAIHNFANNEHQGGPSSRFTEDGKYISCKAGFLTQEDQIVRKFTDKLILPRSYYPIIEKGEDTEALIYSEVEVEREKISIITLPAVVNYQSHHRETMIKRLLLLLYVCSINNQTLITGLWGCGAFGMRPQVLLELWQEALSRTKYIPKKIVFAVIFDAFSNKWKKTFDPRCFLSLARKL